MTDFLNYTVNLFLKDGSTSSGKITSVDESRIVLNEVSQSTNPSQTLETIEIANSTISDLKVVKLPPDFVKSLKNGHKRKNEPKKKKKDSKDSETASIQTDTNAQGDFDFAANLAMFDKKTVFEDFQKNDTVKPENRLVGHNKVENVRKDEEKFGYDEMVLAGRTDNWDSLGNEQKEAARNASITGRSTPVPDIAGHSNKTYTLVNLSTGNSVPVCSPIQLLDIERIAADKFTHSPTLMAEVFATNVSSYVSQKILGGASRLNPNNHNLPPLVLLLIGSERCSARAFAVGRHLSNHGVRVLAYMFNQDLNDDTFLQQKDAFQNAGGKIISSPLNELFDILNNQLDTPVELIIDALQGYDDHLEDIFYEEKEQTAVKQVIKWCNEPQQASKVMSLDIPSGIDGGSGTISEESLVIHSRYCVSMGLPVAGILHAYRNDTLTKDDQLVHLLVDIGIPNKVYQKKSNLRRFDKVWYGSEHVVKLDIVEKQS